MCNEIYQQFVQDQIFKQRHPEIYDTLKAKEAELKQRLADAMKRDKSHTEALSR